MDQQKLENHIKVLQDRHDRLDSEVKQMEGNQSYISVIVDLKKRKLRLKDEIAELQKQLV
jgi:uncharacterized protein YdcH (DUF465 family)